MSLTTYLDEDESIHRQGSIISLSDEDDPITIASSDSLKKQQPNQEQFVQEHLSSSLSNESSKALSHDDTKPMNIEKEYQVTSIDFQSATDISNKDEQTASDWQNDPIDELQHRKISQSDSSDEITVSFGFQQQENIENRDKLTDSSIEEINQTVDYDTFVRARKLYIDPNPELIRRPQPVAPLLYKQNIMVKFLKPPPVLQGPLVIREVRLPQPPPPPPLVIRQRPPPPLSPPPIILREKPPRVPEMATTQVITKTLPPLPPPPRSVIIEKLPPLPNKPRDIIIERWIPYESIMHKRKVIIQRAEEAKPYPPPKNIIITYDKVPVRVLRKFERIGIRSENPQDYTARFGNTLLDTKDLLAQAKELGIAEDLTPPMLIDNELKKQLIGQPNDQSMSTNTAANSIVNGDAKIKNTNNSFISTYGHSDDSSLSSKNHNEHLIEQGNHSEELYAQLADYGLKLESMPY